MSSAADRVRHIFDLAARLPHRSVIHTTNNLQLIEAQARFPKEGLPEFVGWDELNRALPDLWDAYWLPFTEDRRRSMAAIDDWALTPAFCEVYTDAMVAPIDRVCRTDHAKQWLLLCALHINCGMTVPPGHHVIGETMQRLEDANPPGRLPNQFKGILSRANYISLQGTTDRQLASHCPPVDAGDDTVLTETIGVIRAIVRGVVGCLLDERLPRRKEPQ